MIQGGKFANHVENYPFPAIHPRSKIFQKRRFGTATALQMRLGSVQKYWARKMRNMISWQEKYCSGAFPAKESDRCRSRTGGGDRPLPPSLPPSPVMKPYLEQASKICNWTAPVFVSKREKCICLRLFWYFSSSSRVRMCLISITNLTSNNNATYLAVEQFDNFPFWYSRAVVMCRNYRLCTFSFVETSFIIRGKLSW